ncbi:MAG: Rrf2 family transcriptional regulator [Planctomycetia bacterium]|nr:Rrf2 family transcriptional regulator [Planctomycetia bacterium]
MRPAHARSAGRGNFRGSQRHARVRRLVPFRSLRVAGKHTVKISAKTEYACVAMLELALRYGTGEPVRLREIAETHGIPPQFLVQILLQLKGAGLVATTRGAAGGYQLMRSPDEISLGMVMAVIEGESTPESNVSEQTPSVRAILGAWQEADRTLREVLGSITFAELVERVGSHAEPMYYI